MIDDKTLNFARIAHHSLKIDYRFLSDQVRAYQKSEEYELICKAYDYYNNKQDIEFDSRKQIGSHGEMEPVTNAYDEKLMDNQYAKCIDQKRNYLLGRDFTLSGENEAYINKLNDEVFDRALRTKIANTTTDVLLGSEAYWHPYYDENSKLQFKKLDRRQVLVLWNDDEKTDPHSFVRFYNTSYFDGNTEKTIRHLDHYTPQGITMWQDGELVSEKNVPYNYIGDEATDYWDGKLPLIVWRLNATGRLLFKGVKNLQDALNKLKSQLANLGLEDARSTLLWIENYGGELDSDRRGTVRKRIMDDGVIFTVTVDGAGGGVQTIAIEFEPEKRMIVVDMLKRTIIDNMRAFDVKDLRDTSAPNQMNIKAVYSDMAEDALEMENQFQTSFDDLLYFVNKDLGYENEDADVIFNKDMMMNESEVIEDIVKSKEILPTKTLVEQHPWVVDVDEVLSEIETEKKQMFEEMFNYQSGGSPFSKLNKGQEDES